MRLIVDHGGLKVTIDVHVVHGRGRRDPAHCAHDRSRAESNDNALRLKLIVSWRAQGKARGKLTGPKKKAEAESFFLLRRSLRGFFPIATLPKSALDT